MLDRNYPNLRMLRGFDYTESDIGTTLRHSKDSLLSGEAEATLPEPEQEMLSFINANKRAGVKTTVSTLLDKFQGKPYGWYYAAVLVILARLCARGKVDLRADGNLLEGEDLEKAISNTQWHGNVVVDPQADFTAAQVRAVRTFFGDFFNKPARAGEAKALGYQMAEEMQALRQRLEKLQAQSAQYPFLEALQPAVDKLERIENKPYDWFLQNLSEYEDELMDLKEDVIEPIQSFMGGGQKDVFLEAREFLREQGDNFAYLDEAPSHAGQAREDAEPAGSPADRPAALAEILSAPDCFRGDKMQQVRQSVGRLRERLAAAPSGRASGRDGKNSAAAESGLRAPMSSPSWITKTSSEYGPNSMKPQKSGIAHQHPGHPRSLEALRRPAVSAPSRRDYQPGGAAAGTVWRR